MRERLSSQRDGEDGEGEDIANIMTRRGGVSEYDNEKGRANIIAIEKVIEYYKDNVLDMLKIICFRYNREFLSRSLHYYQYVEDISLRIPSSFGSIYFKMK